MKLTLIIAAAMVMFFAASLRCIAQETTKRTFDTLIVIEMKDGNSIQAKHIDTSTHSQVRAETRSMGTIMIPRDSVKSFQVGIYDHNTHKLWFTNPNSTRYFFGPSAIPLKKGEGYFQNTELFLCTVNYGVTNNLSIGGGVDVLSPFIEGSGGPVAMATLKAGFKIGSELHAAIGTMIMHAPIDDEVKDKDESFYWENFGLITYGTMDVNATFGVGYGLKNGVKSPGPAFMLSAMARCTPRFSFITENWVVPDTRQDGYAEDGTLKYTTTYPAYLMYGMRFMSPKIAVDFGFLNSKDISKGIAIGIPYVDFVVKF